MAVTICKFWRISSQLTPLIDSMICVNRSSGASKTS